MFLRNKRIQSHKTKQFLIPVGNFKERRKDNHKCLLKISSNKNKNSSIGKPTSNSLLNWSQWTFDTFNNFLCLPFLFNSQKEWNERDKLNFLAAALWLQNTSAQNWINTPANCNHDELNKILRRLKIWRKILNFHLVLLELPVKQYQSILP